MPSPPIALTVALLLPIRVFGAAAAAPAPIQISPTSAEPQVREVLVVSTDRNEDEAVLLDGSFVRGSVVELAKGSHVTISVLGEPRRIEWSALSELRLGKASSQPATEPATAPTEPAAPAEPAAHTGTESPFRKTPADAAATDSRLGHPRVHIESTNGKKVTLYGVAGEFAGSGNGVTIAGVFYTPICTGSCDRDVDGSRGTSFFVGGERLTPSRRFMLDEDRGNLTLKVRAGSIWMKAIGYGLVGAGAVGLVGLAMVDSDKSTFRNTGIGMTVAGVVMLGVGIPLAVLGRTVVKKRRG